MLCLTLVACSLSSSACRADPPAPPNVVFILIDTLRADHLGFMGYARRTSPTLDKWAAESVVFDRAYSTAPWTAPSIASIFSSLYPTVHHVMDYNSQYGDEHGEKPQGDMLAPEVETLAEACAAGGYQTAAIVANPYLTAENGFAQGFESYTFLPAKHYAPAAALLDEAQRWLDKRSKSKPFFMYLHFMDVHEPWNAPDDVRERFVSEIRSKPVTDRMDWNKPVAAGWVSTRTPRVDPALKDRPDYWVALYDAGIADLDSQLPRLEAMLTKQGLWENSLVIVTADHGEALNEQGGWNHGYSPYDHQYHVPLMFHYPKRWSKSRRVPTTVSHIDLKPTLLDLAGLKSGAIAQGRSYAALIDGGSAADAGFAFCEGVKFHYALKAVYSGNTKIICDAHRRQAVFFDLSRDPFERRRDPVPSGNSALVALKKRLEGVVIGNAREASKIPKRRNKDPRPSIAEQLAQLGYPDSAAKMLPTIYGEFKFDPNEKKPPASAPTKSNAVSRH